MKGNQSSDSCRQRLHRWRSGHHRSLLAWLPRSFQVGIVGPRAYQPKRVTSLSLSLSLCLCFRTFNLQYLAQTSDLQMLPYLFSKALVPSMKPFSNLSNRTYFNDLIGLSVSLFFSSWLVPTQIPRLQALHLFTIEGLWTPLSLSLSFGLCLHKNTWSLLTATWFSGSHVTQHPNGPLFMPLY